MPTFSQLELDFSSGVSTNVNGGLVQMSNDLPEDADIAQKVVQMQPQLEADPQYADRFQPIGEAAIELSTEGQFVDESLLGNLVMDILRSAAQSHMAISTSSSFRRQISPGTILYEDLHAAMPYTKPHFRLWHDGETSARASKLQCLL